MTLNASRRRTRRWAPNEAALQDAAAEAANTGVAWRVPSVKELASLMSGARSTHHGDAANAEHARRRCVVCHTARGRQRVRLER